jgi:hypothetical protein
MEVFQLKARFSAEPYKPGMEDGYEFFSKRLFCEDGSPVWANIFNPWVNTHIGQVRCEPDSYILTDLETGEKEVISKEVFESDYEPVPSLREEA